VSLSGKIQKKGKVTPFRGERKKENVGNPCNALEKRSSSLPALRGEKNKRALRVVSRAIAVANTILQ